MNKSTAYGAAGLVILAAVPLMLMKQDYYLDLIFQTFLFAALASSWNIIGGYGGQMSFGHAIFFGIGAYTTAIFFMTFHISPWLSMWAGVMISIVVGFIIALPTFRLRGPFFSIATLIINQLVLVLVLYFKDVTSGPQGILLPYHPSFMNMIFTNRLVPVYIAFIYLLVAVAVTFWIVRNKLGYQLQAIREEQDASRILGVNPFRVKMLGFLISVALTSLGGSIYAMYIRFVDPYAIFSLAEIGAMFALICMIGGMGTIAGPIVGALLIMPIDILLRGSLGGLRPGLHLIVFSTLLIVAAIYFKHGIIGTIRIKWEQRRRRLPKATALISSNEVKRHAESP